MITKKYEHTWSEGNVWAVPTDSVHKRRSPANENRPPSAEQYAPEKNSTVFYLTIV